jgi:hypothetical protein
MDLLVEIKWREIENRYSPNKIGSDLKRDNCQVWNELTACELFTGELSTAQKGPEQTLGFSSEIVEIWRYSSEISVSSGAEISSELERSSDRNKLRDIGMS